MIGELDYNLEAANALEFMVTFLPELSLVFMQVFPLELVEEVLLIHIEQENCHLDFVDYTCNCSGDAQHFVHALNFCLVC